MSKKEYENVAEFFYSRASKRIKEKIGDKRHKDIHYADPKQISRIVNNNRGRNNRFLIPDSVIETYYKDEETGESIPTGLLVNLDFESEKEILWGTDEEIIAYIDELFLLLWKEACEENESFDDDLYLCDYVPYAKHSTYYKLLFSPNIGNDPRFAFQKYNGEMLKYPAIFYGISEDVLYTNIESAKSNALQFLYNKCKNDFLESFIVFANEITSFHMLDKTIKKDLIQNRFIPLLEKYKPGNSSLGLRVRNLINEDLSYMAVITLGHEVDNMAYRKMLLNASSDYILKLERIQELIE